MTEAEVTALIASLSSDLGVIAAGVITLSLVTAGGLWIIRILRGES